MRGVVVLRLLIWNVFDSKTTIDELRESLPELVPPSQWIWNEAAERFGVLAFGEELPESVGWAQDLVGAEPGRLRGVRRARVGLVPGVELVALVGRQRPKRRSYVLPHRHSLEHEQALQRCLAGEALHEPP